MAQKDGPGVLELLGAGVPFPEAARLAVGGSIAMFAEQAGLAARQNVSALLRGSTPYPYARERDALQREMGIERWLLDALLDQARLRYLVASGRVTDGETPALVDSQDGGGG